ncbi:MAG TPA: gluconate 2-dehydrogenase subunit 3 family protein [Pyrinomonadaceae bacterium]|nr:gluconate 2-dehydrogenase subunit 3 family protein [Pyrinomonadaceae bacterium]
MKLTEQQQQTLRAAVDRVIPPDDYPGAWQSGVGDYLARQFEGDLRPVFDDYSNGLTALDAEARACFQESFSKLSEADQDHLLGLVESGEVLTTWGVAPSSFFNLLVRTTAEGFYSEPEQGGNRNSASWKMIGFE